jgi:deazaflavin-dependent oxidoreductase (nitroreductase family)
MPDDRLAIAAEVAAQPYCGLTTTGRRTGRARTVELWFAADGATVYVLSGGRDGSDWMRNLRAEPRARLRLGSVDHDVAARLDFEGTDEGDRARRLLDAKYQGWREGRPLTRWATTSLPVAFDLVD